MSTTTLALPPPAIAMERLAQWPPLFSCIARSSRAEPSGLGGSAVARDAERPSADAVQRLFELSLDMLGTAKRTGTSPG